MVTDVELGKSGSEVYRVAREEVSMNAVECAFDLPVRTTYKLNRHDRHREHHAPRR